MKNISKILVKNERRLQMYLGELNYLIPLIQDLVDELQKLSIGTFEGSNIGIISDLIHHPDEFVKSVYLDLNHSKKPEFIEMKKSFYIENMELPFDTSALKQKAKIITIYCEKFEFSEYRIPSLLMNLVIKDKAVVVDKKMFDQTMLHYGYSEIVTREMEETRATEKILKLCNELNAYVRLDYLDSENYIVVPGIVYKPEPRTFHPDEKFIKKIVFKD